MQEYLEHYTCTCDIIQKDRWVRHLCNVCKIKSIIEGHTDQCNKDCCFYPVLATNHYRRSMACRHPCPPKSVTKQHQQDLVRQFRQHYHQELTTSNRNVWRALDKGSPQYATIVALLPPGRVLYIKTVLNSALYRMYNMYNLVHFSEHIPTMHPHERALWHGTGLDSTHSISRDGFNRNCTKVCQLGKGVYFSANSNYSLQDRYSPRTNNIKCMVLSFLTVGDCAVGSNGQACLPEMKNPEGVFVKLSDTLVDNVADPTIVVSMTDHEVYPAYLVYII